MRWWLVRTIWNPSKLPSTGMPGGLENSSVTFCGIWGLIVSHGYLSCNMSPNYFLDEVSMWLNCCFFLIYYCFYVPRPLRTSRVARWPRFSSKHGIQMPCPCGLTMVMGKLKWKLHQVSNRRTMSVLFSVLSHVFRTTCVQYIRSTHV